MNLRARTIHFKLVEEFHAEFIISLRTNRELNKHLSQTDASVEMQKEWIKKYKSREESQIEFYFIIFRNDDNKPIGTVRLYDFRRDVNSFCWGSWILNSDKTKFAALESAFLVYQFAFDTLNFEQSHFDVRKENSKVIAFHEKMGAKQIAETELDFLYEIKKESIDAARKRFEKFI
ncbi:GNAT family N-acetyltransferase [Aeromonas veronii]|uniref:GNAT family N-acetyltransferase n=1 Tax=Aeromonas veronii TaxID=654 RepID=UPI003D238204